MSKKKGGGFFSRLIRTIFIVGFVALGAILFLSTLPTLGVLVNYSYNMDFGILGSFEYACGLGLVGFGVLFGGKADNVTFVQSVNGESSDKVDVPPLMGDFNFNYVVFIGIILVLLGLIVAVLFFRKKSFSLFAALLVVLGAILLCLDSVLFSMINENVLNLPDNLDGLSVIDIPSLLLGIFSALSGITIFFHALTIKK